MARRFRKRADLHLVAVPGIGFLKPNQIVEGAEYARFVPHLLEEILDAAPVSVGSKEVDPSIAQHLKDVERANQALREHNDTPAVGAADLVATPEDSTGEMSSEVKSVTSELPIEGNAAGAVARFVHSAVGTEEEEEEDADEIPSSPAAEKAAEPPAPRKRGRPPKKREGES